MAVYSLPFSEWFPSYSCNCNHFDNPIVASAKMDPNAYTSMFWRMHSHSFGKQNLYHLEMNVWLPEDLLSKPLHIVKVPSLDTARIWLLWVCHLLQHSIYFISMIYVKILTYHILKNLSLIKLPRKGMITESKQINTTNNQHILEADDYVFSSKHHKTWLSGDINLKLDVIIKCKTRHSSCSIIVNENLWFAEKIIEAVTRIWDKVLKNG